MIYQVTMYWYHSDKREDGRLSYTFTCDISDTSSEVESIEIEKGHKWAAKVGGVHRPPFREIVKIPIGFSCPNCED